MEIDFSTPRLLKLSDEAYFNIGKVSIFHHEELVLSVSTLKQIWKKDAYEVLVKDNKQEVDAELQYVFDVGSAFHCFVLEHEDFEKRYYVSETKNAFDDTNRVHIKTEDFEFIQGAHEQIKLKHPSILEPSEWNEVTILTTLDGVPFRAKIDKLIDLQDEIVVIDLKSIWFDFYGKKYARGGDGQRWGLIKYFKELNYDLQAHCYTKAIQTYLDHHNINKRVTFKMLMASKDTCDVKMVQFSSEMMQSGEMKCDTVMPELRAFYQQGIKQIEKDEIV